MYTSASSVAAIRSYHMTWQQELVHAWIQGLVRLVDATPDISQMSLRINSPHRVTDTVRLALKAESLRSSQRGTRTRCSNFSSRRGSTPAKCGPSIPATS